MLSGISRTTFGTLLLRNTRDQLWASFSWVCLAERDAASTFERHFKSTTTNRLSFNFKLVVLMPAFEQTRKQGEKAHCASTGAIQFGARYPMRLASAGHLIGHIVKRTLCRQRDRTRPLCRTHCLRTLMWHRNSAAHWGHTVCTPCSGKGRAQHTPCRTHCPGYCMYVCTKKIYACMSTGVVTLDCVTPLGTMAPLQC